MHFVSYFLLVLPLLLSIQEGLAKTLQLSWQDCVAAVQKNSPSLQVAQQNVALVKEQVQQFETYFLPEVYGQFSVNHRHDFEPQSSFGREYQASLVASQNLFAGRRDEAKLKQSQENLKVAEWALAEEKSKVSQRLIVAYQGFLYGKALMTLADEIIERRSNNVHLVELRFNGGMENRGSLLLAQAYLHQAQYEKLQAKKQMHQARAQLLELMGMPSETEFDIDEAIPLSEYVAETKDYDKILAQHPEYLKSQAMASAVHWDIAQAKAKYYPSLDLSANYGSRDHRFFPDHEQGLSYGLSVKIPIYNGGRDRSGLRQAEISVVSAKQQAEETRRRLMTDLETARGNYRLALEKSELDKSFEAAAAIRSEIARRKYDNGLLSFEAWDDIENDMISRLNSLAQSRYQVVLTAGTWLQAQGKGVIP